MAFIQVTTLLLFSFITYQSVEAACKKTAFTATHPDSTLYLLPGSRLRFKSVLFDAGNNFDVKKYEYVVPKSGIYYFIYCLYSGALDSGGSYYRSGGQLFINNKPITDTLSYNSNRLYYIIVSTCQAIVHPCKRGDRVYLVNRFTPNYVAGFNRSTFTGYCISG